MFLLFRVVAVSSVPDIHKSSLLFFLPARFKGGSQKLNEPFNGPSYSMCLVIDIYCHILQSSLIFGMLGVY